MSTRILHGNCLDVVPTLDAGSVQCVVTSPPYFGLRRYLPEGHPDAAFEIGSELTPDAYVAQLVAVFAAVRRVLADTGVVFLNLGDSYASTKSGNTNGLGVSSSLGAAKGAGSRAAAERNGKLLSAASIGRQSFVPLGLKSKDLLMIPARVALALQADGWWLRSDIIWAKPNPMPESCKDRPASAHEHVFMLTKQARYYWDADSISEDSLNPADDARRMRQSWEKGQSHKLSSISSTYSQGDAPRIPTGKRNARNVWTIATQPFPGSHFATMPPKLAERCIKAGSRPGDVVLDPFSGAGTTALVANRLGRHAVGIELNENYIKLAEARLVQDSGLFSSVVTVPHSIVGSQVIPPLNGISDKVRPDLIERAT